MKNRIVTIAALASLAFAPAAFASDKFEAVFDFAPVEVSTPEGAEKIYEELEAMIEKKCEPRESYEKFLNRSLTQACVDEAIDQAVADIGQPEVTAIHEARRG